MVQVKLFQEKANPPNSATDLHNMEVGEFMLRSIYACKDNPADRPIIQEMYRRDKIGTAYRFGDVETLLQELSRDNISAADTWACSMSWATSNMASISTKRVHNRTTIC